MSGVSRRVVLGGAVAAGVAAPSLVAAPSSAAGRSSAAHSVDVLTARLAGDLIAFRRDLHRHPETAGNERRTATMVAHRLRKAGLNVVTGVGGHGVVGVLKGARRGRTVAYRADMDAVPPNAQIGGGTEPAHVCGHDIHTSVGVGIAEVLAHLRHRVAGTLVFIFQPAEESLAGAAAMLADGVLGRFCPEEIHALHCAPFPVGHFAVMPGYGLPGQDHGTVTLAGPGAPARAQTLATAINALGTVSPPANAAGLERLVAALRTPDGPLQTFIFMTAQAVDAEVQISYRCWPKARYTEIREKIKILAGSQGPATTSFPAPPFPAMRVPEREGEAQAAFLRQKLGEARITRLHAAAPFNGEDYALFLNQIPGTYTYLGVRTPDSPIQESFPHQGAFTPDEQAIPVGIRTMADWLTART